MKDKTCNAFDNRGLELNDESDAIKNNVDKIENKLQKIN